MIKKRKMILLGLVLALVVGLFASNGQASADFTCSVGGNETPKRYCYGKLYRNYAQVKTDCGKSFNSAKCVQELRKHVYCSYITGGSCDNAIKSYVENANDGLIALITKEHIPPCDKVAADKRSDCELGKDGTDNWKYYYATEADRDAAVAAKEKKDDGTDTDTDTDSGTDPAVPTITPGKQGTCTSILGDDYCNGKGGSGILGIIRLVISILTGAVVIAGTIGIVVCGVLWMTARDNEAQVAKAKKRLLEIVVGMAMFILFGLLANLLIPRTSGQIENDMGVVTTKEVKK